ncbi:hypothetical protein BH10BAC5_BH10BAC5_17490 [soil metagenome]
MITDSPEKTFESGKYFAATVNCGDVILLKGELGSGKTQFVKGICEFFGVKEKVNSPTFNIVNEYASEKCKIFHFDLYRIKRIEELQAIGFYEYFRNDSICIIEWPEMIEESLGEKTHKISFFHGNGTEERVIEFLK